MDKTTVKYLVTFILLNRSKSHIRARCSSTSFHMSNSNACAKNLKPDIWQYFGRKGKNKKSMTNPFLDDNGAFRKNFRGTYDNKYKVLKETKGTQDAFKARDCLLPRTNQFDFSNWLTVHVRSGYSLSHDMLLYSSDYVISITRPYDREPSKAYESAAAGRSMSPDMFGTSTTSSTDSKTAVCSGGCGNGQCTGPNQCTCSRGYTGSSCRTPVCSGGCGNGQCTEPKQCSCSRGYTGSSCRTPVCSDGCGNGQCTGPNKCTCSRGYTGSSCRTPICPVGCGNGQCTGPNKCTCSHGYTGSSCRTQSPEPNPTPRPSPTVPSGQPDVAACRIILK
ncbi:unnamed protein product, partial [Meganyctiphanes norvegica]